MRSLINEDQLVNLIIRPSKFTYTLSDLGPNQTKHHDMQIIRQDFITKNQRGFTIHGSIYYSNDLYLQNAEIALLYLHCNCGSRIQAKPLIYPALKANYILVSFDFAGCGQSEGKYISLGFHQIQDLRAIINRIQQKTSQRIKFILWGRSMGAVTIIRYLSIFQNNQIVLVILDSPFINLKDVITSLVKKKASIPKMFIELVLNYIEPIIEKKAAFSINSLDLDIDIQKVVTPTIFLASKKDNLVPYEQIQLLYQKTKTKKSIYYMDEQHHQQRSTDLLKKVFKSIWKNLLEFENQKQNTQLGTMRSNKNKSILLVKKDQSKNKLSLTLNRNCLSREKKNSFENTKAIFLKTAHLRKYEEQNSKENRKKARISSIKLQSKQQKVKRQGIFIRDLNIDL